MVDPPFGLREVRITQGRLVAVSLRRRSTGQIRPQCAETQGKEALPEDAAGVDAGSG